MLGDGREWERHAACQGLDSSLFFAPNRFESKREREAREAAAKAICHICPVIDACRETALMRGEAFGVWGGLGEFDRRELLVRVMPSRAV